jgi:hypothetical protein
MHGNSSGTRRRINQHLAEYLWVIPSSYEQDLCQTGEGDGLSPHHSGR